MKRQTRAVLGMTALLLIAMSAPVRAADPLSPLANPAAAAGPTTGAMAGAIAAVEQAGTVPAAVTAFARGLELDRGNAGLYQAYVRRLVEFGTPHLAVAPAQALVWLQPDNALGLAVLSIDAAEHADMRTAVTDAVIAGTRGIDEPFVQHAVAQVVAWYDTAADRAVVPASIAASLEALRPKVQDKPIFAVAYGQAVQAYHERTAAARKAAETAAAKPEVPTALPPLAMTPPATAQPVPTPQVVNNYYTTPPVTTAQQPEVVYAQPNYVYTGDSYAPAYYAPAVVYPSYGYGYYYPSVGFGFSYGGGHFRGGGFGDGGFRGGGGHR